MTTFLANRDRVSSSIPPSRRLVIPPEVFTFALAEEGSAIAALPHQNNKRENYEKLQRQTPGSTVHKSVSRSHFFS